MNTDDEWDFVQEERNAGLADAGSGLLRITLLFGSAALAIAMFIVPLMNRTGSVDYAAARNNAGLDQMATGSIATSGEYVVRHSVLQRSPASVCVIKSDGSRNGDC